MSKSRTRIFADLAGTFGVIGLAPRDTFASSVIQTGKRMVDVATGREWIGDDVTVGGMPGWAGVGARIVSTIAPTFTATASGTTFDLPWTLAAHDDVQLLRGGLEQWQGTDFTIAGRTVTIAGGYDAGEVFQVRKRSILNPGI